MEHFQQDLNIATKPESVYAALTTIDGLRGWWTQECDGAAGVGQTIHFRFGSCFKDMRVASLQPGREVRWHCTRAHIDVAGIAHHAEWLGTEPVFTLTPDGKGGTDLHFEHHGLLPSLECYGICLQGWQHFLASLRQYAETGTGTPYIKEREAA